MAKPLRYPFTIAIAAFTALTAQAETPAPRAPVLNVAGIPSYEAHFTQETGLQGEIQGICSMPDGEIAFLTNTGVTTFDGTNWSETPDMLIASSILRMPDDSVAITHASGILSLTPDDKGGYQQRELIPPEKFDTPIPPLRRIETARGYIFGLAGDSLVLIRPNGEAEHRKLSNWASDCFKIGDDIFITGGSDTLLNRWDWETETLQDAVTLLDGSEIYEWIVKTTPRSKGGVWLLTENDKIIGLDGANSWSWPGNAEIARRGIKINAFKELSDGSLALGTSSQGLLVFKADGSPKFEFSKQHGLEDVRVIELGTDDQGGLWIATHNCLTRIPQIPRSTLFNASHGLPESVHAITFFNGKVFLATPRGLYANNPRATQADQLFELVLEQRDISDILALEGHLLISGPRIKTLDTKGNIRELDGEGASHFLKLSNTPNTILAVNYRGVSRFQYENGAFSKPTQLKGPSLEIQSIAEGKDGSIIGSLSDNRIARVFLDEEGGRYESSEIPGRNRNQWSAAVSIDGNIYINGIPCLRWDPKSQAFVEDQQMHYFVGDPPYGFEQVYGTSSENAVVTENPYRSATVPRPPPSIRGTISSLGNAIDTRAKCIAYDDEGRVWAGGPFGLVLSLPSEQLQEPASIAPRIHKVESLRDGILLPILGSEKQPVILQPNQNALRITVEYPLLSAPTHHQYQIHLEGVDGVWAEYSKVSMREFTNLAPGAYTLKVNARGAIGEPTAAPDFHFVVRPPWTQTPIAYTLYTLSGILVLIVIVLGYNRRQIRKSRHLQALVKERTQEVERKNQELENQAQRLEQQNEELAHKTEELTSTTETLSATLHQLQEMQDKLVATARTAGKAEIAINVLHNVGNVLNSINVSVTLLTDKVARSNVSKLARLAQLIESHQTSIDAFLTQDPKGKAVPKYLIQLSKSLDKEIVAIQDELTRLEEDVEHVKNIVAAQRPNAKNQNSVEAINLRALGENALEIAAKENPHLNYEIHNKIPGDIMLENDKHRLLEIVLHLISNAQEALEEAQPANGIISLSASISPERHSIELYVSDNGSGIEPEALDKLFREGFTTKENNHGFGLHSAANTARMLGGHLSINSPGPNKGATATLTLPVLGTL